MKRVILNIGLVAGTAIVLSACTKDKDSPGVEYMPDMYRSPAIEAYVDYGEFREETHPELKKMLSAKVPPKYTIPFHSDKDKAAWNMPLPFKAPIGGDASHGLYGYDMYETADEFMAELEGPIAAYKNPIPYSDEVLAEGKEIYTRMCSQCHGEKGDGKGSLVENGKISGVANFTGDSKETPEGKLFYYITYGKGIMGAHGMLLSREERWKVVHQLRKFQDSNYPNVETEEVPVDTMNVDTTVADVEMPAPDEGYGDENAH